MSTTVDYYLAPVSPWTYLGHERFARIAAAAGATVRVLPMDLGKVFAVSGGLPLPNLTVSIKSWHYIRLFILHMRNDGCERTVR
jgi:2-hydroxychromene-2-carboxylate isomerase